MLVAPSSEALDPGGEGRVEVRPPGPRNARVRHFACDRVLDRVLALALDRRAQPEPDEISFLEQAEVRLRFWAELVDGAAPEDAADDRGGLEGFLLGGREQVDARRHHGLHRVRHQKTTRKLLHRPAAVPVLEQALIDQGPEHLFHKEGIAFGLGDHVTQEAWWVRVKQAAEQLLGRLSLQRLEYERLSTKTAEARSAIQQLGPRRHQHEQWAVNTLKQVLQQIEERILGPVEILDEDGGGTGRCELLEQRDPGVLEAIAGSKRVQVACDVQPERQPQDLTVAESGEDALRRIPVEDAKLLLEDLAKRPERNLPVGEAPARAL